MNDYCNKILNSLSEVEVIQTEVSAKQTDLMCQDARLDALFLHIEQSMKLLTQLENDINDDIERVEREIDSPHFSNKGSASRSLSSFCFGRPFFKDRQYFSPYPNEDVITKKKYNEINLTDVPLTRRWQRSEKKHLMFAVRQILVDRRIAECRAKLYTKPKTDYTELELEGLEKEMNKRITKIHTLLLPDLIYDKNDEYDWMKISATDLHGTHTPEECRALWNLYYSPAINKHPFTPEENEKLKELVYEYCYQNWDEIAERLGTRRSGYQCLIQYQLKLNKVIKKSQWSKEENYKLLRVVKELRVGQYIPWGQVTKRMEGRTKVQVFNHYKYTLAPFIKKGRFSEAESQMILAAIHKYGNDYRQLARFLPGRTPVQIRDHYKSHLQRLKIRKPWNNENDPLLMDLVEKWGTKKWSSIVKFFPDFSRAQLRHRYLAILRYKKKYPDKEIVPVRQNKLKKRNVQEKVHDLLQKCKDTVNPHSNCTIPLKEGDLVGIQEQLGLQKELKKLETRGRRPGHKKPLVLMDRKMLSFFDIVYRPPPLPVQSKKVCEPECRVKDYEEEADKVKEILSFFKLCLKIPADNNLIKERLTVEDEEDDFKILKAIKTGGARKSKPEEKKLRTYGKKAAAAQSEGNAESINKENTSSQSKLDNEGHSLSSQSESIVDVTLVQSEDTNERTVDEHAMKSASSADLNVSSNQNETSVSNKAFTPTSSVPSSLNDTQSTETSSSNNKKRKFVTSSLLHNSKCTYTFAEYVKEYLKNRDKNNSTSLQPSNIINTVSIDLTQGAVASTSKMKCFTLVRKQLPLKTYAFPKKAVIFPVQNQFLSCDTVPPIKKEPLSSDSINQCSIVQTVTNSEGNKQNVVRFLNSSDQKTGVCPVQNILAKSASGNVNYNQILLREGDNKRANLNYLQYWFPPCITTLIGCRTLLMSLRNVAKQFNSELRKKNQVVSKLRLSDLASNPETSNLRFSEPESEDSDPSTAEELMLLRAASKIWFSRLTSLFYYPLITTNLTYRESDTCFGSGCRGGAVASRSKQVLELEQEFNLKEYQSELEECQTEEDSDTLGHIKKKLKKDGVEKRRASTTAESLAEPTTDQPKRKYTKRDFGGVRGPSGRSKKTVSVVKDNVEKREIKKPKTSEKEKDQAEDQHKSIEKSKGKEKDNDETSVSRTSKALKKAEKAAGEKTKKPKDLKKQVEIATSLNGEIEEVETVESQVENVTTRNKETTSPKALKTQVKDATNNKEKTKKPRGRPKKIRAPTMSNGDLEKPETLNNQVKNADSPNREMEMPKALNKEVVNGVNIGGKAKKQRGRSKKEPEVVTKVNGEIEMPEAINKDVPHNTSPIPQIEQPVVLKKVKTVQETLLVGVGAAKKREKAMTAAEALYAEGATAKMEEEVLSDIERARARKKRKR